MKRQGLPGSLRYQLIKRENHTCQKCGQRHAEMHAHHMNPVRDGGPDVLDNLALLCASCHMEWEGLEMSTVLTFAEWLPLPTVHQLLAAFMNAAVWTDDVTAREAREGILNAANAWKALRATEPHLSDTDYEDVYDEGEDPHEYSRLGRKHALRLRKDQERLSD